MSKRARTETRLYLPNLAYCTSEQDVMGLFSGIKSVKHCSIYYDGLGRSLGAGEVIFSEFSDAKAAMKEFESVDIYLQIGMKYSDLPKNLTDSGNSPQIGATPQTGVPPSRGKLYLRGPYLVNEGFEESTSPERVRTGTRLYLSNLAYCTSQQDVMRLFSRFKSVEHCTIYYDRVGRALGASNFPNLSDAVAAMKELESQNIYLDENELNLEIGMKYLDLPEETTQMQEG